MVKDYYCITCDHYVGTPEYDKHKNHEIYTAKEFSNKLEIILKMLGKSTNNSVNNLSNSVDSLNNISKTLDHMHETADHSRRCVQDTLLDCRIINIPLKAYKEREKERRTEERHKETINRLDLIIENGINQDSYIPYLSFIVPIIIPF